MFDNNIRVMKSEVSRLQHEVAGKQALIKDNNEKIKMNKQLPYLVSNVIEILNLEPEQDDDGAAIDLDAKQTKCVVIKTTTRQTVFLPVVGLVDPETLKPGDLVGVNKDSYLILDALPAEYDSRVKVRKGGDGPAQRMGAHLSERMRAWQGALAHNPFAPFVCLCRCPGHGGGREADGGLHRCGWTRYAHGLCTSLSAIERAS